jgi:NAD+--asparagine ADP-ribosyltransferase
VEDLLLRSSNNFKFLENLFLFSELNYDENFSKEIFSKYKDYFFNEKTFESAKLSFKKIVKNLDEKIISEKLLELNFLADKADLNLYLCFYLSHLFYSSDCKLKIKKN